MGNDKYVTWVRINPDPSQAEPPMPPLKISRKVKLGLGTIAVIGGFAIAGWCDYRNSRDIENEDYETAKSLMNAEDTPENREAENQIWSRLARQSREVDLHWYSSPTKRKETIYMLNNNKVQGAARGQPLN